MKQLNREPGEFMLPGEVALLFRVDTKTIARWAERGDLECFVTPGGRRRYTAASVQALLSTGTRP